MRLAAADLHHLAGPHPGGAGGGAGAAVEAEEGLLLDRLGEFELPLGHRPGQGDPAAGAGALAAGQGEGRAGRQAEAAAHALQHALVGRGVLRA